jgi:hypothetical protein
MLESWFNKLEDNDKKEVIKFLYGEERKTKIVGTFDGIYSGPVPGLEGYRLGPPPQSSIILCPKCGHKFS